MAQNSSGFPDFRLEGARTADPVSGAVQPTNALGAIAQEADGLGAKLTDLAAESAKVEGQQHAAADIAAGQIQARNDGTVRGQAYDAVAKNYLASSRTAQLAVDMQQAYEENPDNPVKLGPALDAVVQAYQQNATPYADLNAELAGHYTVRRADFMARAIAGQRAASIAQDKANFTQDLSNAQDLLDQTAAGAGVDADGGKRVADAANLAFRTLAKYGPKEAFDFGGLHFDADPNRRAALRPDEMGQVADKLRGAAVKTWIVSQGRQLSDEASRKMYAAKVEQSWKSGDPAFKGLSGGEMEGILRELDASADRARADDNAQRAEYARKARDAIEAFTWGGDPDFSEALANARMSGDQGLAAQVEFYKNADPMTKGVLRTVVARQLGLLGTANPDVPVDATGQPIGGDYNAAAAAVGPDAFTKALGRPAQITSAVRSAAHNADVGGSPTSEHVPGNGKAWDIVVPGMTSAEVFAKLRQSGLPYDQLIDEHDHVHFGIGPKMRGQAGVTGGAWATPKDVQPRTPAYIAWASTREGFATDPVAYLRGGQNRPPMANVPIVVPNGAFADPASAEGQAWTAAIGKRWNLANTTAAGYGVPVRMLTNGERDFYKSAIEMDPMKGIQLAQSVKAAAGPQAALGMMRELGETDFEAGTHLHIADLAAGGSVQFARLAAQGLQLEVGGKAHLSDQDRNSVDTLFDKQKGGVPSPVLAAARATAQAALVADQMAGVKKSFDYYVTSALGGTALNGRVYGGPTVVNGGKTIAPRWLAPDHMPDALEALGGSLQGRQDGPVWSNGQPVTAQEFRRMQPVLQPDGLYRFVNPKTGNPLMSLNGGVFRYDLDRARGFLAGKLGAAGVKPAGF